MLEGEEGCDRERERERERWKGCGRDRESEKKGVRRGGAEAMERRVDREGNGRELVVGGERVEKHGVS